jgi:hypothetical protein
VCGYAPRARQDRVRARRLGVACGRPLNFTGRRLGHPGGRCWTHWSGIHLRDDRRSVFAPLGCLTPNNSRASRRRLPGPTQTAAPMGNTTRSLGASCTVLPRGDRCRHGTRRPRPNLRRMAVAAYRLMHLCCVHGDDRPKSPETGAHCAERLTIGYGLLRQVRALRDRRSRAAGFGCIRVSVLLMRNPLVESLGHKTLGEWRQIKEVRFPQGRVDGIR